ncbi:MAG: AhpC/TSA family protein [Acidimicrobiales bacterium]
MHCRQHAAQLRSRYQEVQALGAEVVAIGTGDAAYARVFVTDEHIPFPVLVDDEGDAARAASLRRAKILELAGPRTWAPSLAAWRSGNRQHRTGRRSLQLGATFVIGPGPRLRYEHLDADVGDHGSVDEILDVLGR